MIKQKITFNPFFLILIAFYVFFSKSLLIFYYLLTLYLHELGHYICAKKLGYKLNNICFMPYGAMINLESTALRYRDEIIIAIAGPLVNLVICIVLLALWYIFPTSKNFTSDFLITNLITFLFNLLPLIPLDGSRVLLAYFSKFNKRSVCFKVLKIFNYIFAFLLIVLFIFSAFYKINYSFIFMSFFIILSIDNNKNFVYANLFNCDKEELLKKKALPIKLFAINYKTKSQTIYKYLSQSYYCAFLIVDDNMKPLKIIYENQIRSIGNNGKNI
jgi:stage IV sporulation protein FB